MRNFYKIENQIYCVIQKFKKIRNLVQDAILEQELTEFFSICAITNDYELVEFEKILNKCVLAFNKNDDFF